nr:MAG TPA: hypothetical protein [Caudoviricetes sp.]
MRIRNEKLKIAGGKPPLFKGRFEGIVCMKDSQATPFPAAGHSTKFIYILKQKQP